MIDLHCHLLPGLDDGPDTVEGSLEMARIAVEAGIRKVVATPHIRDDYPFPIEEVPARTADLSNSLGRSGIGLEVLPGGEVSLAKATELSNETLATLCLGAGPYLLVESPYTHATDLLERSLFDLQVRGFQLLLAHPERSPSFIGDLPRLAGLVDRGVLCSVTADSMIGRFGRTVRAFTYRLFREGLVHDVSSDAHDARARPPILHAGFEVAELDIPGLFDQLGWFTQSAPAAILRGEELPPRPQLPGARGWRRFFSRPGRSRELD